MDEFLTRIADGIAARIGGPMNFRFILQPLVMVVVGVLHGLRDAKAGRRPVAVELLFDTGHRKEHFKAVLKQLRIPILVGVVLDAIAQYLMFHQIRIVPALIVGVFVIAVPYLLTRGITNRIASARKKSAEPPEE